MSSGGWVLGCEEKSYTISIMANILVAEDFSSQPLHAPCLFVEMTLSN